MKTKVSVAVSLVILALASCAPAAEDIPTRTAVVLPTLIPPLPTVESAPLPATPTEFQLPFNDKNVENQYCRSPEIPLPLSEAQGLSDNEIVGKLVALQLAYFSTPQAPDWCRIDGYKIDEVYYDEHALAYPPVEPQGDIMRVVRYSIKLVQIPNMWMSLPGEVDQQNWLHTVGAFAVFRTYYGYTMKAANP
jgi:hypothetical protein